MANINVPPMIPLEQLREMKKSEKKTGMGKTFLMQKNTSKKDDKPYKLKSIDGIYMGAVFPLEGKIVIGRNPGESNIVYPGDTVGISRKHCSIYQAEDGQLLIQDLGSSQGTFFADGTKLEANVTYRINRGECFYLASKRETYKVI